jgi:hypothetical protein
MSPGEIQQLKQDEMARQAADSGDSKYRLFPLTEMESAYAQAARRQMFWDRWQGPFITSMGAILVCLGGWRVYLAATQATVSASGIAMLAVGIFALLGGLAGSIFLREPQS